MTACVSCATKLAGTAKFCSECGTPVTSAATTPAEYKQVTVLFADVVHSMDIASVVGAERLREIMADLADRCAAVVERYGGTVDKFTGDGIMAVFGAPTALEDHAVRACMAALGVQEEAKRLAVDVHARDGVDLQLRVGLNSGQVIVGQIGSGSFGYTAIGEQVGMAQRMESAAPPGGVMLSPSTARLVDGAAALGEPEIVRIKGADEPVTAYRLLGMGEQQRAVERAESNLVGRRWEMAAVEGLLDRATDGHGAVVGVVGSPGIGKSRLVREVAAMASDRSVEVFSAFCESHASDIPFHVVARLLRAACGVGDLDGPSARAQVRARAPDAELEDLLLFDDLLGIADPEVALPTIDPDARRRRLTALINSVSLARIEPVLYVIEDAHWIDEVSESMLAEFLTVIPQTSSLVLITYRPDYRGALANVPGAQTISLAPLSDTDTAALLDELLGTDPSVAGIRALIAGRAAGNPYFAQEIVHDLAERGVLEGDWGGCVCRSDVAEVRVPATLQAAIAARIDRLGPGDKTTLNAAAVIGSRFTPQLLTALGADPLPNELVKAELIDQVRFPPHAEYAFRHPLIRTVAYESQLKSDRARLHRRLAAAIEQREPESVDENAALIAEHLEVAGDLRVAYSWHMRAGAWLTNRDIASARRSWERARAAADSLPLGDADRTAMCIAPRTLLCGTAWRVHIDISGNPFDELRELCAAAGDKASLVIGMAGLVMEQVLHARVREASVLASEYMALLESVGDPTLTLGLSFAAIVARCEAGEPVDMLRWSQTVIDLADGDPMKGNLIGVSPLATALAWRGLARWWLGRPGWHDDFDQAVGLARTTDSMTYATVIAYKYGPAIPLGVLLPDADSLRDISDALQIAERSGDDVALASVRLAMGLALVHCNSADRERGLELLAKVRDMCMQDRFMLTEVAIAEVYAAQEKAKHGDLDGAVRQLQEVLNNLFEERQTWCIPATGIFVELLLARGCEGDEQEAESAIARLAAAPTDHVWPPRDVMVLRLRALLVRAHGDDTAYRDYRDRYRAMAASFGFEGHMKWAEAMP